MFEKSEVVMKEGRRSVVRISGQWYRLSSSNRRDWCKLMTAALLAQ